eukprot:3089228-Amphidinium_carterae.1
MSLFFREPLSRVSIVVVFALGIYVVSSLHAGGADSSRQCLASGLSFGSSSDVLATEELLAAKRRVFKFAFVCAAESSQIC